MSTFCKLLTTTRLCYDWTGRPMTYLFTIHKKATSSSVLHLDHNKIRGHTECTVRHQPNILHSSPSRQTQSIKCSHSVLRKEKKITHSEKVNFTMMECLKLLSTKFEKYKWRKRVHCFLYKYRHYSRINITE